MELGEEVIENIANLGVNTDKEMLTSINLAIAEGFCRNGDIEDGVALYKLIAGGNNKLQNIFSAEFIEKLRNLAQELYENKKYTNALIQYKRLLSLTQLNSGEYLNLANCLIELGQQDAAIDFLKKYEESASNKVEAYGIIGEILGLKLKKYEQAISYLEKYVDLNKKNPLAYNTLGHFYSLFYYDKFLDKQLECFLKALALQPNNPLYMKNAIYTYEKLGDAVNAEKYYKKLFKLNPTPLDYYDYGSFLTQQGRLAEGYKYLDYRLQAFEKGYEYPKWLDPTKRMETVENMEDKTILLFHEGGFGDSFMYVRFVEQLAKYVKKIILFVPDKLKSLFEYSDIKAELHSMTEDLTEFEFDYNATLMDLPKILETTVDALPGKDAYLKVPESKVEEYKNKYLNSNKFKIGISYGANPKYKNATNRDIALSAFYPLTKLKDVEVYSLQVLDPQDQINNLPQDVKITNLAPTFKSFEETAAAIMNMDLIISTDNVILNLAGALGAKTYGLFNIYYDHRWYKVTGEDVGWYNSVRPFHCDSFNDWENLMEKVIQQLQN